MKAYHLRPEKVLPPLTGIQGIERVVTSVFSALVPWQISACCRLCDSMMCRSLRAFLAGSRSWHLRRAAETLRSVRLSSGSDWLFFIWCDHESLSSRVTKGHGCSPSPMQVLFFFQGPANTGFFYYPNLQSDLVLSERSSQQNSRTFVAKSGVHAEKRWCRLESLAPRIQARGCRWHGTHETVLGDAFGQERCWPRRVLAGKGGGREGWLAEKGGGRLFHSDRRWLMCMPVVTEGHGVKTALHLCRCGCVVPGPL